MTNYEKSSFKLFLFICGLAVFCLALSFGSRQPFVGKECVRGFMYHVDKQGALYLIGDEDGRAERCTPIAR
jgi:hypothetical protein